MRYNSRTRAAGGQQWHRIREQNPGVRVTGLDDPSFIERERQPVPNLREKAQAKQTVRTDASDYPAHLITVIPAGKKASKTKRNKR